MILDSAGKSLKVESAPRVGVACMVFRGDELLLGLRSSGHGAGTWQFPGGKLEFGERVEDCARRELWEETGVSVSNVRLGPYTNDVFETAGLHYITLYTRALYEGGEPRVREPDKCARWQWYPSRALPRPLFLPIRNLLKKDPRVFESEFDGN
jgi:8-oxo-dGTP diphosphatase